MLRTSRFSLIVAITAVLSGCATILSGRTQSVTIETNPPGARCELTRDGKLIGTVESTPGVVSINKTKHDILIACKKSGYNDAKGHAESGTEGATFANIVFGGVVGWGIDSAAGTDNKYPNIVTINLSPSYYQDSGGDNAESGDLSQKLAELKRLKNQGLLTEQEYQSKKTLVLRRY